MWVDRYVQPQVSLIQTRKSLYTHHPLPWEEKNKGFKRERILVDFDLKTNRGG